MAERSISKSKYLSGLQCSKLLWLYYNAKDQIPEYDAATQAIFDQGHEVGNLAKKLYPHGVEVEWDLKRDEIITQSLELLKLRKPLFEAGFLSGGAYARVDILDPVAGGKWDIVEVKSSTEPKDVNYHDLALQKYCYEGVGISIRKCRLMHINSKYVRDGSVEPEKLFAVADVTAEVRKCSKGIAGRVENMLKLIGAKKCPAVDIGPHCTDPYECPMMAVCWAKVNECEDNIFTLTRLGAKAWPLYLDGIVKNADIPANFHLTGKQQIQVEAEKTGKPHVDIVAIREFLDKLIYPLYFLDFETFQTAIPLVDGTSPYEQIPFQFSLHISRQLERKPEHVSWLWEGQGDPRIELLKELKKALGSKGSIISFNAPFEQRIMRSCVTGYPEYGKWFDGVLARHVDLLQPFRAYAYYNPSQHGSASMKQVLPALTGKSYEDLEIQNGGQASEEFKRVTFRNDITSEDRTKVRNDLEEYCGLDTMGMVDIVQELMKPAK